MLTYSPTLFSSSLFLVHFTYFCALIVSCMFMMLCVFFYFCVSDNKHELIQVAFLLNITVHKTSLAFITSVHSNTLASLTYDTASYPAVQKALPALQPWKCSNNQAPKSNQWEFVMYRNYSIITIFFAFVMSSNGTLNI